MDSWGFVSYFQTHSAGFGSERKAALKRSRMAERCWGPAGTNSKAT